MNINELRKNWNELGKIDPFFAILSYPHKRRNKWKVDEFFATGKLEIQDAMNLLNTLQIKFHRNRALDFGCGVGRLAQPLADYFDEVYGVDIASSMIKLANKYNHHSGNCHYYLNETDNLRIFTDKSFDFIYSSLTLAHMRPSYSKAYIREFLRLLAPQGIAVFHVPIFISQNINIHRKIIKCLRALTPVILHTLYLKVRYGTAACAEMYTIPPEEIIHLVNSNGGDVLDIHQRFGRYIIRKT